MKSTSKLVFPTVLLLLGGTAYGSVISANKLAVDAGMPFIAYSFWQMIIASAVLLPASMLLRSRPKVSLPHLKVYGLVATVGLSGPLLILAFLADKLPPSVLTLVVALMGVVVRRIARASERSSGGVGKADPELRDRALAAVVGVGIMRARPSASAAGDNARSDLV